MDLATTLERQRDRALAIGLFAATAIEVWLEPWAAADEPTVPLTERSVAPLVLVLVLAAAVAWRRRAPLVVLAIAVLAVSVSLTAPVDAPVAVIVALIVTTYSVGVQTRGRAALAGATGVAILVAIAVAKDLGPDQELNDVAAPVLLLGGPWLAGLSIRSRQERETALEDTRRELARAAVSDERARIARDLHDAVAHSIGVIILQARGARRTMTTDPAAAREALDVIESTGSEALAEMRGLVGVLRDDDEPRALAPPPSLRHIDALVERVREAGLPVEVSIEGRPVGLPAGLDTSAYRIVQEALTNVLAHAGPARASVVIRYEPDRVDLEIGDTGLGPGRADREGHGLVGMRERATLHAGRIETGPRPGGGFLVRASLPLRQVGS